MKHLKKFLFTALTVFAVSFVCMPGMQAEAATPPANSFYLAYMSSDMKSASIQVDYKEDGINGFEVELCNANLQHVATDTCSFYASFDGLKKNKLYYYRVRGLDYDTPVTDWSVYKAFFTPNVKANLASKTSKTVVIKPPKIAGIKNYTLYMSTKRDSGYKKVGVIKPGKSKAVSKFKGKAFAYYANYYYRLVPKLKKSASVSPFIGYFYITRTYR